ncbi:MAG: hypothetical protein ACHQ1D_01435 [Nitrososphaerales archaeon]
MYDLSIICPTIRIANWPNLLESIDLSCSAKWEIIFVGPERGDDQGRDNVSWIYSQRSPNACQQLGLIASKGDIVATHADDCLFSEGALDSSLRECEKHTLVCANYWEGGNEAVQNFSANHCYPRVGVPDGFVIFNANFSPRTLLLEYGGFDCQFLTSCLGHLDLGLRLQLDLYKIHIHNVKLSQCAHEQNRNGTHWAYHDAQLGHDYPKYIEKYSRPIQTKIDINNWQNSEEKWYRFK